MKLLALRIIKFLSPSSAWWTRVYIRFGNIYFSRRFTMVPFHKRILFLPYCLRHPKCPERVSREDGLICPESCSLCKLGELRKSARDLGYVGAYVVPSSRILTNKGLMASRDFIWTKIKEHKPVAAVGAVCLGDFRQRYMRGARLSRDGVYSPDGNARVLPQGLLLYKNKCVNNDLDWRSLERLLEARSYKHTREP